MCRSLSQKKVLNTHTGEVINTTDLVDADSKYLNEEWRNSKDVSRLFGGESGFAWLYPEKLIEKCAGNYNLAFKFLYLCSFLDSKNKLIKNARQLRPSDLRGDKNIWGVNRKHAAHAYNKLKKSNLLIEEIIDGEKVVKVTKAANYVIFRGSLQGYGVIRAFYNGVRKLYELSPGNCERKGRVLNLLPHLDSESNLILSRDRQRPATKAEIINYLNYNSNFYDIGSYKTIKVDDMELLLEVNLGKDSTYYVNPYVFYGGNNLGSCDCRHMIDVFGETRRKQNTKAIIV